MGTKPHWRALLHYLSTVWTYKSSTPLTSIRWFNTEIMYNTETRGGFCCLSRSLGNFHNRKAAVPLRVTLKELGFPNHQPQSKQITLLMEVLLLLMSNKKVPIQLIWYFIGWRTGFNKMISCIMETREPKNGGLLRKTSPTISPLKIRSTYIYMENAILKLNHTVVQGLANSILKLSPTVVQGCVDAVRTYRQTKLPNVT